MTRERAGTRDVALLGIVGALVCCGLPVLLAVGGGVTIVGIGLQSWLLIAAGLTVCAAGVVRWRQRTNRECNAERS